MKLKDVAKTIRSKNAGVNRITFDIIFRERSVFERVRSGRTITREKIAALYQVPAERVVYFDYFEPAQALKFSIARERPSGSMGDPDVFGCQQYAPLFDLDID